MADVIYSVRLIGGTPHVTREHKCGTVKLLTLKQVAAELNRLTAEATRRTVLNRRP